MNSPAAVHLTTVSRRHGRRRRYVYWTGVHVPGVPGAREQFTCRAKAEARATELAAAHGLLVSEARLHDPP